MRQFKYENAHSSTASNRMNGLPRRNSSAAGPKREVMAAMLNTKSGPCHRTPSSHCCQPGAVAFSAAVQSLCGDFIPIDASRAKASCSLASKRTDGHVSLDGFHPCSKLNSLDFSQNPNSDLTLNTNLAPVHYGPASYPASNADHAAFCKKRSRCFKFSLSSERLRRAKFCTFQPPDLRRRHLSKSINQTFSSVSNRILRQFRSE